MAKYTVTHTCGCEHTYNLVGKHEDRYRKIEWLEKQDCPTCRRKAEEEAAAKATEGLELPALKGSPKQVAWANTIRGQFIAAAKAELEGEALTKGIKLLAGVTNASTFIDYRNWGAGELLIHLFHEAAKVEATLTEETPAEAPEAPAQAEVPAEPANAPQKAAQWRKVAVNAQNVEATTESGVKIKLPHSSKFDGYSLWVSQKLLRSGRHSYEYLLSVKSDMEFALKKYGQGKWNKFKVQSEKTVSADELAEAFGGYVEDAPRHTEPAIDPEREEIIKHVPAPLEAVEIDADPELVR